MYWFWISISPGRSKKPRASIRAAHLSRQFCPVEFLAGGRESWPIFRAEHFRQLYRLPEIKQILCNLLSPRHAFWGRSVICRGYCSSFCEVFKKVREVPNPKIPSGRVYLRSFRFARKCLHVPGYDAHRTALIAPTIPVS